MLKLSKKVLFAVEAVLDIAYHAGSTAVQSREITERQCIPKRYLEQALQDLVRQGILLGVRGPRGGYRLARERRRITIGDIVRVVTEGADDETEGNAPTGSELGHKVVQPLWQDLHAETMARLDGVTIDDLCVKADAAGIPSAGRRNLDYSI